MSLARLTQLFLEGRELVLVPPSAPDQKIPVWVAKLNAFEEEQAQHAGRIARARLVTAMKEIGTPEFDLLQATKVEALDAVMIDAIVQTRESRFFLEVLTEIRSDDEWRERLEIIDFSEEDKLEGAELKAYRKVRDALNREMLERQKERVKQLRQELREMPRRALEDQYEESWLDGQGLAAFGLERARWQTYLCMRTCVAIPPDPPGGPWDHSRCDHRQHFLANVEEVDQLPQFVRDKVDGTYADITMPPSLARFTVALASSSASPEPSGKEEDSTPSGPEETSPEPATT